MLDNMHFPNMSRNGELEISCSKIFAGIKMENGLYRERMNNEFKKIYGQPDISQITKAKGMGWLGHVYGISENRN